VVGAGVARGGGGGVGQPVADGRAPAACHRGRRVGIAPGGVTRGPGGGGDVGLVVLAEPDGPAGSAPAGVRPPCGRAVRVGAGFGPSAVPGV